MDGKRAHWHTQQQHHHHHRCRHSNHWITVMTIKIFPFMTTVILFLVVFVCTRTGHGLQSASMHHRGTTLSSPCSSTSLCLQKITRVRMPTMFAMQLSAVTNNRNDEDEERNSNDNDNPQSQEQQQQQQQQQQPYMTMSVDTAIQERYACTRFERYDGIRNSTAGVASDSNTTVIQLAMEALSLSQRAPTGFNAQPYKVILVHDPIMKLKVSRYCAGKNAYRVRDADCTVVFLADKQVTRTFRQYQQLLERNSTSFSSTKKNPMTRWGMFKLKCILALFSSGYPLPRALSVPISFIVRSVVSITSLLMSRFIPFVPTLTSAETWATKNTMLVVAHYLLAATARGLSTCPMEGINAAGIRRVLKIPPRYAIPIIVATGTPYHRPTTSNHLQQQQQEQQQDEDDVGMGHGKPGTKQATPRYSKQDMIFYDSFGSPATQT